MLQHQCHHQSHILPPMFPEPIPCHHLLYPKRRTMFFQEHKCFFKSNNGYRVTTSCSLPKYQHPSVTGNLLFTLHLGNLNSEVRVLSLCFLMDIVLDIILEKQLRIWEMIFEHLYGLPRRGHRKKVSP